MQMKKFIKENASFIALFFMLTIATASLMTACNAKVNPSSPGIATVTQTPIPPTNTPNVSLTPLPAGSIAFIGWARNGAGQFGFVPTVNLPSGTTIYFTDLSWDTTLNSGSGGFSDQSVSIASKQVEVETLISVNLTAQINAGVSVFVGNTTDASNTANLSITNIAYFNNSTSSPNGSNLTGGAQAVTQTYLKQSGQGNGDKIIAFTCPYTGSAPSSSNNYLPTGTVFTTAMIYGPDGWSSSAISHYYDSGLPTGLTSGTNAVDLHQLWQDALTNFSTPMATAVAGGANENAMLNGTTCPAYSSANTASNWIGCILGAGSFSLANAVTAANQGNVPCSSGYGFAPTPTVVMAY